MLFENKGIDLKLKKYDYNKILSSITIDTIKKSTEAKKKGLFGRIGSALAGKKEVDREQIQTKIKMVFNNVERSGSLEDQLKNIFNFSEKYYSNAFERIKTNYANLNYKKRHLISINSKILASSEDLLLFYITQNQYSALLKYQNTTQLYNTNLKTTKFATISILICLLLGTVILFWYALYNYKKETELEIANSTSQKNIASLNRLIGMLGHEIKAPLSAISYQTSELKEKNNNPNLDKTINSLNFTSNSMQITVDQILNYYKNKNNAITIQNSKINLDKEITELLDPLRVLANVKKIDVVCNTLDKNNALAWVRADKGKIQQLFYNIIGNAIKFSNQGTITITRQLTPLDNNHVKFDVTIKDTGCGIPKEELELIFNEFYQSNHHHDKMKFGAGLGLSLCKELVELYNGKISVTSQVGKGTEISFYLILEQSDSSEETNKSKIITKFKDRTIHVAVIDDDKIILKTIGNLLEKINFNYTLFENVALLKNHLTTQPVDLIISDINIGNHSGLQLANEIKQLKTKKIPIIAITADPFMEISNGENTNFDAIMIKPIEKEEFYHKIEHLLN
jgi:signal transduction histidine kinase/CheY-like chemotaxis protein